MVLHDLVGHIAEPGIFDREFGEAAIVFGIDNGPAGCGHHFVELLLGIALVEFLRGACALDAPVTGGPPGAEAGTLTIMVGGDRAEFDRAAPVLSKLGTTLSYFGAPGNGQRAKLVNQVVAMQNIIGAIEGLFLARKAGLDGDTMLHTLQNGMADSKSLRNSAAKAIKDDFAPNFNPAHVVKDLSLAIEEADSLGLDLPGLKNARARWQELIERFPNARAVQEIARLYM